MAAETELLLQLSSALVIEPKQPIISGRQNPNDEKRRQTIILDCGFDRQSEAESFKGNRANDKIIITEEKNG